MLANTPAPQKVPKEPARQFLTKTQGKTCRERMERATDRRWQTSPKLPTSLEPGVPGHVATGRHLGSNSNAGLLTPGCDPGVWLPALRRSLRSPSSRGSRLELRRPPNCSWSVRRSPLLVPESFRLPFCPAPAHGLPSGGLGDSPRLKSRYTRLARPSRSNTGWMFSSTKAARPSPPMCLVCHACGSCDGGAPSPHLTTSHWFPPAPKRREKPRT